MIPLRTWGSGVCEQPHRGAAATSSALPCGLTSERLCACLKNQRRSLLEHRRPVHLSRLSALPSTRASALRAPFAWQATCASASNAVWADLWCRRQLSGCPRLLLRPCRFCASPSKPSSAHQRPCAGWATCPCVHGSHAAPLRWCYPTTSEGRGRLQQSPSAPPQLLATVLARQTERIAAVVNWSWLSYCNRLPSLLQNHVQWNPCGRSNHWSRCVRVARTRQMSIVTRREASGRREALSGAHATEGRWEEGLDRIRQIGSVRSRQVRQRRSLNASALGTGPDHERHRHSPSQDSASDAKSSTPRAKIRPPRQAIAAPGPPIEGRPRPRVILPGFPRECR
jgi:hypothetical protein